MADDQWQAEFDEDKRRYDQEWAYEQSRGSGGGGSSGGSTDSEMDYSSMGKSQIRAELDSCSSAAQAEEYALYMINQGADENTVWAAYELIWGKEEEPNTPAKNPSKSTGKYDRVTLTP